MWARGVVLLYQKVTKGILMGPGAEGHFGQAADPESRGEFFGNAERVF